MYFYIIPNDKDAMHHGILGMKWGVRRYQPYSVVPRGSGKGGKEIGEAANYGKKDIKAAKKNVWRAFNDIKSTHRTVNSSKTESKKYKKAKAKYDEALNQLKTAKSVLGEKDFNKTLNRKEAINGLLVSTIGGLIRGSEYGAAYNIGDNSKVKDLINKQISDIGKVKTDFHVSHDEYGNINLKVKNKGGSSTNIFGHPDNKVYVKDLLDAKSDFQKNRTKIKEQTLNAIMEDPYIYESFGKNQGISKEKFRNSLDVKSIYISGKGPAEVSVWEKNDNSNILGGHSLDMEIDLKNPKKPRYVSVNG